MKKEGFDHPQLAGSVRMQALAFAKKHKTGSRFRLSDWYFGVTNDPPRRLREHCKSRDIEHFKCWYTRTAHDAALLEKSFHLMGGKPYSRGNVRHDSAYFYIFLPKMQGERPAPTALDGFF